MGYPESELSLLISDDREIQTLNSHYRNKDAATDVLSFPLESIEDVEAAQKLLGDVVISLETAARQAMQANIAVQERVLELAIHGVLHLLGYDHENVPAAEAEKMFTKEEELYKALASELSE